MSDVQQYLIKFERDKTAAEVIARKTAKGTPFYGMGNVVKLIYRKSSSQNVRH